MATAPRAKASRPKVQTFEIRVKKDTLQTTTAPTLAEKMVVRLATGMPFEAFWAGESRVGEDSLCVLWWLARRANGEPQLAWAQHLAEWPEDLTADDLDLKIVDESDDSPEA